MIQNVSILFSALQATVIIRHACCSVTSFLVNSRLPGFYRRSSFPYKKSYCDLRLATSLFDFIFKLNVII